jgi:hypothetical protein
MSNITFAQNHPFQVNVRSTEALVIGALMLQARGSCTLLSMVNWVNIWKERGLPPREFMGEEHQFVQNSPFQVTEETL